MLRGMRVFPALFGFLGFCFNVCAFSQSYVYALGYEYDSVSRGQNDAPENLEITPRSGQETFAAGRRARASPPLTLPVSVPALGVPMLQELLAPAHGVSSLPASVRKILLPTSLPPPITPTQTMVVLYCHPDKIIVEVQRAFFGLPQAQRDLSFGTCRVSKSFTDRIEYSNTLSYTPVSSGPVVRAWPFAIPIQCIHHRYFNSYKPGYNPCPKGVSKSKPLKMPSGITLTPLNDAWQKSDTYLVGQPMNFEVKVPQKTGHDRAYINTCYVTQSADPTSTPQYPVIDNYGCMVDSLSSSQSKFVLDPRPDVARFTIGAFFLPGMGNQTTENLFMHCEISVGGPNASSGEKACTFDGERWTELFGANAVCACCSHKCPVGPRSSTMNVLRSKPLSIAKEGPQTTLSSGSDKESQRDAPTRMAFEDIWNFSD